MGGCGGGVCVCVCRSHAGAIEVGAIELGVLGLYNGTGWRWIVWLICECLFVTLFLHLFIWYVHLEFWLKSLSEIKKFHLKSLSEVFIWSGRAEKKERRTRFELKSNNPSLKGREKHPQNDPTLAPNRPKPTPNRFKTDPKPTPGLGFAHLALAQLTWSYLSSADLTLVFTCSYLSSSDLTLVHLV